MRPSVIFRKGGVNFAGPVVREPDALDLLLKGLCVPFGNMRWVFIFAYRVTLRGKSESIPSHRVHHMIPLHPPKIGEYIGWHVVFCMPHVKSGT